MSMFYSDQSTKASDQEDGPLEHAEQDKERELELAQEAFEEVIASLYKTDEVSKPRFKSDTGAANVDASNRLIPGPDLNNISPDKPTGIRLTATPETCESSYQSCESSGNETSSNNGDILTNHEPLDINSKSTVNDKVSGDTSQKDLQTKEKDTFKSRQENDDSEGIKKNVEEKERNILECDVKSDLNSNTLETTVTINPIERSVDKIQLALNGVTNMIELEASKEVIRLHLDTILSEYISMKSQYTELKSKSAEVSQVDRNPGPPPPMILPPPPPPPPPPPMLVKKGNNGMPNESFSSMLNKAKINITPGENGGVDEIEVRIKNKGKNNLKADIMSQLRNALNNRKKRTSLNDKYQDLK